MNTAMHALMLLGCTLLLLGVAVAEEPGKPCKRVVIVSGKSDSVRVTQASVATPLSLSSSADAVEPSGVKSAAVKAAVRRLARMLRSAELDWVLDKVKDIADARIAKLIRKHAHAIADKLDELAKWEELSLAMVRDQLTGALKTIGVAESTSRDCFLD